MPNLKKIQLIIVILLLFSGAAFLIFAIFFNKATLQITAQAPFSYYIQGIRSESCLENTCSSVLAPGIYKISLTKTDYQNIDDQVTLRLGETTQVNYQFKKNTQIQAIGDWNPQGLLNKNAELKSRLLNLDLSVKSTFWTEMENILTSILLPQNIQISPDGSQIIIDDGKQVYWQSLSDITKPKRLLNFKSGRAFSFASTNNLIYLGDNPETYAPTLYSLDLTDAQTNSPITELQSSPDSKSEISTTKSRVKPQNQFLSISNEPQILTTFVRKINQALLIANPDLSKVAVIDQSDPQNIGLYLIDTQKKTRQLLQQGSIITDLKWLSSTKFLLQKRNPLTFTNEIYLGDTEQPGLALLALQNDLPSISIINDHTIVFAQPFQSDESAQTISGFQLVKLDLNSTSDSTARQQLFNAASLNLPVKIQYQQAQKQFLFVSDNNIYSLNLEP